MNLGSASLIFMFIFIITLCIYITFYLHVWEGLGLVFSIVVLGYLVVDEVRCWKEKSR